MKNVTRRRVFPEGLPEPKLVFLQGPPFSGKKTQAHRLALELGFLHLDMDNLISAEIRKGTDEGQALNKAVKSQTSPPAEVTVELLAKALTLNPADAYIITGFLKSAEEGIQFEQRICEIRWIVNFTVENYQILAERFEIKEVVLDKLEDYHAMRNEALEFYRDFGLVRDMDCTGLPDVVYQRLRKSLTGDIYAILGPPGLDKSKMMGDMVERYNLTQLSLDNILYRPNAAGKPELITDDIEISDTVANYIRKHKDTRFLIPDFPANIMQLRQFEISYGPFKQVYALEILKEELIARYPNPSKVYAQFSNYVVKVNELKGFRKGLIAGINVNDSEQAGLEQIAKTIEPELVIIKGDYQGHFMQYLKQEGFQYLNPLDLARQCCYRRTDRGKQIIDTVERGKIISPSIFSQIISAFVFSGMNYKKVVIGGEFPSTLNQVKSIEEHCCAIQRLYYVADNYADRPVFNTQETSIESYFFNTHRFHRIDYNSNSDAEERAQTFTSVLNQYIKRCRGKYILVTGPMLSGKTTITNLIVQRQGYQQVDWEALAELIKTKKSTEDEPYENVTWKDMLEELDSQLNNPEAKLIFDDFPPESLVVEEKPPVDEDEEEEEKTDYFNEITQGFLGSLGEPYIVLRLKAKEEVLEKRLFERLELGEEDEIPEDQKDALDISRELDAKFDQFFKAQKLEFSEDDIKSLRDLRSWRVQTVREVGTGVSLTDTTDVLQGICDNKLLVIQGPLDHEKVIILDNLCMNYQLLHINVPRVINEILCFKLDFVNDIKGYLSQRVEIPFLLKIRAIQEYIKRYISFRQQVILLSQFTLKSEQVGFPRNFDEALTLQQEIGKVVGICTLSTKNSLISVDIEDIPVVHYPMPKGEDEEDEPPADEDEDEENPRVKEEQVLYRPEPLPPRSEHRAPLPFAKIFQIMSRNLPIFRTEYEDFPYFVEEFVKEGIRYVAGDKFASLREEVRFDLVNVQLVG